MFVVDLVDTHEGVSLVTNVLLTDVSADGHRIVVGRSFQSAVAGRVMQIASRIEDDNMSEAAHAATFVFLTGGVGVRCHGTQVECATPGRDTAVALQRVDGGWVPFVCCCDSETPDAESIKVAIRSKSKTISWIMFDHCEHMGDGMWRLVFPRALELSFAVTP